MTKATTTVLLLGVGLVVSNGWWAYRALDSGITYTYQQASLDEATQAMNQALALLNAMAADGDLTRQELIRVADNAWSAGEPFEKEGFVWVGRLGLAFDGTGNLIRTIRNGGP